MRILFATAIMLGFSWLALSAGGGTGIAAVHAETVPPAPTPAWRVDPGQHNTAVLILDYAGRALKAAYFFQEPTCQPTLATATLTLNARNAFSNTLTGAQMAHILQAGNRLPEMVTWAGEFFDWSIHLGDFTAKALLTPCRGEPIFAGESIWMGEGVRPFPRQALPASALVRLATNVPPPPTLATVAQTEGMTVTALMAWTSIADLNLVHDLAQPPFDTQAFLYRPATGFVDPHDELAHAEWIFIIYRAPTLRAQTPNDYYLPLIRQ